MSSQTVYHEYKHLENISIKGRIRFSFASALDMLQAGKTNLAAMRLIVGDLASMEMYEAAEGVERACNYFEVNPQLAFTEKGEPLK